MPPTRRKLDAKHRTVVVQNRVKVLEQLRRAKFEIQLVEKNFPGEVANSYETELIAVTILCDAETCEFVVFVAGMNSTER